MQRRTKPFLAIHGARDRELDAATNLGPLVRYLGEAANADFTVATIPDIDHWMWVCTQPSEPEKPCAEMQFSPKVLDLITNWSQGTDAVRDPRDFFVVPTLTCQMMFVFVVLAHNRRRLLHVNVTDHPTSAWTRQQLREYHLQGS